MAMSTGSPCAACKFLRRKCTTECVFAPYFPPEDPHKFANVHKIFGASNVSKILNELPLQAREDAVNSLAYEADARVKDPVYGCVGAISILQSRVAKLQAELAAARSELCRLKGFINDAPLHYKPPIPLVAPNQPHPSHQISSPSNLHLQVYPSSGTTSAFSVNSTQSATPISFSNTMHAASFASQSSSTSPSNILKPSFAATLPFANQAPTSSCTLSDCRTDAGADHYALNLADSLPMAIPSLGFLPPHPATLKQQDSSASSSKTSCSMNVGQFKLEPQS
uniref:AS2 protein n=1 Tax=Thelypteris nipponica TaxID=2925009 RepID=A0A411F6X5_9MONI|nr:AS2 protein [Coryphopteris nipponica]